jgi:phosphoribosylformylglycinamidine cyclo-ligase
VLPIFEHLRDAGQVSQEEMMRTFNMGIGLIAAIPAAKFTRAKNLLDRAEEKFYVIGRVVKGERRVQYTPAPIFVVSLLFFSDSQLCEVCR